MYKDVVFLTFFSIIDNTDFVPEELLELVNSMENHSLGYRDVMHLPELRGMATLLGDMSPVSRVDSYFTNMKLPWESGQQKEIVYSVGLFETLIQKPNEEASFLKGQQFRFGHQSICMAYSEMLGMFAVGLDTGYIHLYKIEGNRLNKVAEEFSQKLHNKRVMALAFDGLKGTLFSIGEDGFLQACDPVRKQVLGCGLTSGVDQQVEAVRDVLRQRLQEVLRDGLERDHPRLRPHPGRLTRCLPKRSCPLTPAAAARCGASASATTATSFSSPPTTTARSTGTRSPAT